MHIQLGISFFFLKKKKSFYALTYTGRIFVNGFQTEQTTKEAMNLIKFNVYAFCVRMCCLENGEFQIQKNHLVGQFRSDWNAEKFADAFDTMNE